ncbi:MAG: hypothetical protein H6R19_702 [Proteobacteria bacterium]|nr:hypothetical protein [Pseudomonadota bacterium]
MAETLKLRTDQLHRDHPLPWDVFDSTGRLLLRKGFVIEREAQIESLMERGMYVDAAMFHASPALPGITSAVRHDPIRDWEDLQAHLGIALQSSAVDASMRLEVREIARLLLLLTERYTDLVLAAIMLMDHRKYPLAHSVHCAAIANMVARRAGWKTDDRLSLICAALTMNVGMLALQLHLCNQREALSPEQRTAINQHPAESVRILSEHGIEDPDWLSAVLEHHEKHDGSGYPRKITNPCEGAMILQTADIFAAKVSPRAHRKPMIASEATKLAYIELSENGRNPYPAILVKELGIYPPGTIIRLANGETGVVQKRGAAANTPIVAILSNAHGVPMLKPLIRNTATDPAFKIASVMAREKSLIGLNFERIWAHQP